MLKRWDQESPDFFKRTYRFGSVITAGATTILVPDLLLPSVKMPDWLPTFAGYFLVAGAVIMAMSRAATKKPQPEDMPDKNKDDE